MRCLANVIESNTLPRNTLPMVDLVCANGRNFVAALSFYTFVAYISFCGGRARGCFEIQENPLAAYRRLRIPHVKP